MTKNEPLLWTVSALTHILKDVIENKFSHVAVQGEISNCKLQSSGHLYFTLKDAQAQISAVMFRNEYMQLDFSPKNGDLVVVEGAINVYAAGGRYQINIRRLQRQGLGQLLIALEERKRLIAQRGWFKKEHKKPLPLLPKRIGVVTSPTGAAIRDIIEVLSRRSAAFNLILYPVKVQGDDAAEDIAKGIEFFNERCHVDVLLVGRGGGSFEDLWCFNSEVIASAIFHSKIPIICAVGHETDHCIAEYVADMRAPTPSAAAELIMAEQLQLCRQLAQLKNQVFSALSHRLQFFRQRLTHFKQHPAIAKPRSLIEPYMQRLDDWEHALDMALKNRLHAYKSSLHGYKRLLIAHSPKALLQQQRLRLTHALTQCDNAMRHRLGQYQNELKAMQATLLADNPKRPLEKGYSMVFNAHGALISDANQVHRHDMLKVVLANGSLVVQTREVKDEQKEKQGNFSRAIPIP